MVTEDYGYWVGVCALVVSDGILSCNHYMPRLTSGFAWIVSVTAIFSMQANKVEGSSPTAKDVLLVIDSLKKQVAAERVVYVKV